MKWFFHSRSTLPAALLLCGLAARAEAQPARDWAQPLSEPQQIAHVLNRIGFGPRSGDERSVREMGGKLPFKPWANCSPIKLCSTIRRILEVKLKPICSCRFSGPGVLPIGSARKSRFPATLVRFS